MWMPKETMYISCDKLLDEYRYYMKLSHECMVRFRHSEKKVMNRRINFGPDAVCLIHEDTREFIL